MWVLGLGGAAVVLGISGLVRRGGRQRQAQLAARLRGGRESLRSMPREWWRKRPPAEERVCYRTKTDALNKFREWNQRVIDDYGGESAGGRAGEFDAMTKWGALPRNVAEAMWLALPPDRTRGGRGPFCIEDIDLDALNDTSAGRDHPVGFQLPDYVIEREIVRQEYERHRSEAEAPF